MTEEHKASEFVRSLIEWWEKGGKREYPWRRVSDPFKVLLAEVMLRKTTSAQVANVFSRIAEKYGTPEAMCKADVDELVQIIKSLGMEYRRSRLLKSIACTIVEKYGGNVPSDPNELMKLPGVGRYIANAVSCFGYKKRCPIVDTNVARLLVRFFGLKPKRKRPWEDAKVWETALKIMPNEGYVEFNYALLDFSGQICMSRAPQCNRCVVSRLCSNFSGGASSGE